MGIIDVNVEKPAFKREERVEKAAEETTSGGPDAAEANPRRGRTLLKTAGALAVGLLGMITFRKLRNRDEPGGGPAE